MRADGRNTYLQFGDNSAVVKHVKACYEKWRNQPQELVSELRKKSGTDTISTNEQCYAIFDYLLNNVNYVVDKVGYQFIKSPARLLADGTGDCKSMTIFIASCLHCLGIPHTIRFVNFDGGTQYTHVYPIAYDETGKIIIIDAVERDAAGQPIYNYARPFAKNKDIYYRN